MYLRDIMRFVLAFSFQCARIKRFHWSQSRLHVGQARRGSAILNLSTQLFFTQSASICVSNDFDCALSIYSRIIKNIKYIFSFFITGFKKMNFNPLF